MKTISIFKLKKISLPSIIHIGHMTILSKEIKVATFNKKIQIQIMHRSNKYLMIWAEVC